MKKFFNRYKKEILLPACFICMTIISLLFMVSYLFIQSGDIRYYDSLLEENISNNSNLELIESNISNVNEKINQYETNYGNLLELSEQKLQENQKNVTEDLENNKTKLEDLKNTYDELSIEYKELG